MKKIAILTSGGDSSGMNSAVRSVVRYALSKNLDVVGVSLGYQGLIDKNFQNLSRRDVSNIITDGGTCIKTARSPEFLEKAGREKAYRNLESEEIDAYIVIGGDGSFRGGIEFHNEFDFPVMGIPATIDNDVAGTQRTLGFDTALNTAMDAVDKIRDTAYSMDRIFIIEVMGRLSGAIAVHTALAGGAEDVLIPEIPSDLDQVMDKIDAGRKRGKKSWIIIIAEGVGKTRELEDLIKQDIKDVRVTVIGHIQRGGSPSAFDRYLGGMLGQAAVDFLLAGRSHHTVGWVNERVTCYPLEEAVKKREDDFSELMNLVQTLT
jgi:6-phosphofructokinase 1